MTYEELVVQVEILRGANEELVSKLSLLEKESKLFKKHLEKLNQLIQLIEVGNVKSHGQVNWSLKNTIRNTKEDLLKIPGNTYKVEWGTVVD